jgi:hypothetical protein
MSDPHAIEASAYQAAAGGDHPEPSDHGTDHGHDEVARDEDTLGPVDVAAWGAGILGILIALVIAACFALATSG